MEHRPCERCGNLAAPFYDDDPKDTYCINCLNEAIKKAVKSHSLDHSILHPVILPPLPVLFILAATVVAILCVAFILTVLH